MFLIEIVIKWDWFTLNYLFSISVVIVGNVVMWEIFHQLIPLKC